MCYKRDCAYLVEEYCLSGNCIAFGCPENCKFYNTIINVRHTSLVGKPVLLSNTNYGKLSNTQQNLLNELNQNRFLKKNKQIEKIKITMKDLSCITAVTGLEYSLFERNDLYILVKGSNCSVYLKKDEIAYLTNNYFKWVGHTHPGYDNYCLYPSEGDRKVLSLFSQESSCIYNSVGNFIIFDKE